MARNSDSRRGPSIRDLGDLQVASHSSNSTSSTQKESLRAQLLEVRTSYDLRRSCRVTAKLVPRPLSHLDADECLGLALSSSEAAALRALRTRSRPARKDVPRAPIAAPRSPASGLITHGLSLGYSYPDAAAGAPAPTS